MLFDFLQREVFEDEVSFIRTAVAND